MREISSALPDSVRLARKLAIKTGAGAKACCINS